MKISASNKLYIGFALAIILSVLTGVANYFAFKKQSSESQWVSHTYNALSQITEVQYDAIEMQSGKRGFRVTNEERFLASYHKGFKRIRPAMEELRRLVLDNYQQVENINKTENDVDAIIRFWEALPQDFSAVSHQQLVDITTREKALMDNIRADLSKMRDEEEKLLAIRQDANKEALSGAIWVTIIGTVLVQIIVIILIYFIISEFRSRKMAEDALQDKFDEVTILNETANNRNWILTGTSKINDSLQGTKEIAPLAESILQTITRYAGLPAGAVYIYNKDEGKLVMQASVSLPATAPESCLIGEGLVGSAALVRNAVITRNIPADYWSLQSAAGSARPGEILCMPLWYGEELKGVIELASFGPFASLCIEFLNVVGDNIAIAINAADAREKIMQLLNQVQLQKVDLQNQQEELRQTNEELTRQAEVLQASEEELRVQEEELRQINAELEEKNEAVEVSRQALATKARELEITGKYKSEFLANMSHELRTPLNSVLILAKLLSENRTANLTDKQVEYSKIIHKSGTDLLNLINDILDLSKIEAGKTDFHFEYVKVQGIIDDLKQMFSVVSDEKSIKFIESNGADVPKTIYTDKLRLEQVIRNLLSNAFKFTPKYGTVTLAMNIVRGMPAFDNDRLRKAGEVLEIAVSDTGIGIPESKQQLIFEAFQQADGSTSRKYGGTGLGLSISKELIKRLGGEIKLRSTEGHGSTFSLYLPLDENKQIAGNTDTPIPADFVIPAPGADIKIQDTVPDDREQLVKGDKVMLIIEDDPQFAKVVQDFAREKKFKTIVALHGDEGLYYAKIYHPSAIILDIQLPVMDGWTILKALKADEKLKDIPVHVISAMDNTDKPGNAAITYLKKPLEKEDLENAFGLIGKQLAKDIKRVLVVSGNDLRNDSLKNIITERHSEIVCDYAASENQAIELFGSQKYDCVVVDIGRDLNGGLKEVKHIHALTSKKEVPVIIYLDKDLTSKDEMQFKKISDVIIRNSEDSQNRLMDEMELFLYRVEEVGKSTYPRAAVNVIEDEKMLAGKNILLADDDMRNVFALTNLLEEQEMNIITAENGKEALQVLNEQPDIDIVLMDIMMPEMDGFEAMRLIRQDSRFKNLPVIALTAKAMQGDKEKAIEAGASDYITKPVDSARLFSLMRVWLSA